MDPFPRKELNRAPAFAQSLLLPPERGIDYTEHAPWRAEIGLSLDDFLLLRACSSKSQLRPVLVVCHARDNAFGKGRVKLTTSLPNGNSSAAVKASLAAATSRSASAQMSHASFRRPSAWQQDLWPGFHRSFDATVGYRPLNPVPRTRAQHLRLDIAGLDA